MAPSSNKAGTGDNKKPKGSTSGYVLFAANVRKKIVDEMPGATFGDISREVGKQWKLLSEASKQKHRNQAKKSGAHKKVKTAEAERTGDKKRRILDVEGKETPSGKGAKKAVKSTEAVRMEEGESTEDPDPSAKKPMGKRTGGPPGANNVQESESDSDSDSENEQPIAKTPAKAAAQQKVSNNDNNVTAAMNGDLVKEGERKGGHVAKAGGGGKRIQRKRNLSPEAEGKKDNKSTGSSAIASGSGASGGGSKKRTVKPPASNVLAKPAPSGKGVKKAVKSTKAVRAGDKKRNDGSAELPPNYVHVSGAVQKKIGKMSREERNAFLKTLKSK